MQLEDVAAFRLSPHQSAIWSTQPDAIAQSVVAVEGPFSPSAVSSALRAVVARHEILRTNFVRKPGLRLPLQVVSDAVAPVCPAVDLSGAPEEERDAQLEAIIREEAGRRFEFERGLPFRAVHVKLSNTRSALVLTLPAVCADAGSFDVIVRELAALYGTRAEATDAVEPLQYVDFAEWQNDMLASADGAPAAEWLPDHELSFARHKVGHRTEPGLAAVPLPATSLAAADRLAESCGLSSRDVLLAAWATVLARLTDAGEVGVGVVSRDEANAQLATMVGPQARVVPVGLTVDADERFDAVARAVAHRAASQQDADLSGRSLPRAGFEWRTWSRPEASGVRFDVERVRIDLPAFDIALIGSAAPEGWTAEVVCRSAAGGVALASAVSASLDALLRDAGARPEAAVALLDIVGDDGLARLTREFNQTAVDWDDTTITELFDDQAERTPDRPALVFGDDCLSYRELRAAANGLARELRDRGVAPGTRAAILMDRSADAIVAMLGVLKAGGAYVPLSPDHPTARVLTQIEDARPAVVITDAQHAGKVPEGLAWVLDRGAVSQEDAVDSLHTPDDTCYVIYTSGSTGVPKGVQTTHRGLANYSRALAQALGARDAEEGLSFALVSTLTADLGNTSIFPALVSGGCIHVLPDDAAMDGRAYGRYCSTHDIDVLKVAPSQLTALLMTGDEHAVLPRRWLVLGGEPLTTDFARRLARAGSCRVMNHYGPTETTIGSLTFPVDELEALNWRPQTVPIGRPIANTAAFVLDRRGQPLPAGFAGELCIAGAGLASGYLGRPEEDAARFVGNQLAAPWGGTVYRTGDRARVGPDGNFEHLGRIDHQVKIRGFRVEPGEVEAAVRSHPGVRQAVVVAREDSPGDTRLVAYIVPEPGVAPSAEGLRAVMRERLPDYMIPSAFVPLETIPLTGSGKVDLRALPVPTAAAGSREYVAPRNDEERALAGMWAEVLGVERVGITDDFFALGGHSLMATRVMAWIRRTFDVEVPLQALWETPTVAGLAIAVAEAHSAVPDDEDEDLADLLAELEGLSDEEAERLLASERRPPGRP